jgi:hypothetical protein
MLHSLYCAGQYETGCRAIVDLLHPMQQAVRIMYDVGSLQRGLYALRGACLLEQSAPGYGTTSSASRA